MDENNIMKLDTKYSNTSHILSTAEATSNNVKILEPLFLKK